MKKNYLLDEYPVFFSPTLAKKYGVNEAVILQLIHVFLSGENSGVLFKSHRWIYNSYVEWTKLLPFLSRDQVANALRNLEKKKVILSCQPFKGNYDRRKAYRIDYKQISND